MSAGQRARPEKIAMSPARSGDRADRGLSLAARRRQVASSAAAIVCPPPAPARPLPAEADAAGRSVRGAVVAPRCLGSGRTASAPSSHRRRARLHRLRAGVLDPRLISQRRDMGKVEASARRFSAKFGSMRTSRRSRYCSPSSKPMRHRRSGDWQPISGEQARNHTSRALGSAPVGHEAPARCAGKPPAHGAARHDPEHRGGR